MEEKKDSKSKIIIIVLIIVIILLIGGGVTAFVLFNNSNANKQQPVESSTGTTVSEEKEKNPLILDYDNGAVALDENGLERQIEEMRKNSEGNVSLEYRNEAVSDDGKHFTCYLANSDLNTEDMFIAIFRDQELDSQMYLSGLLRPGTAINEFDSEIQLETGEYTAVAMFTTVGDDHETMTSQIAVEIKLIVH